MVIPASLEWGGGQGRGLIFFSAIQQMHTILGEAALGEANSFLPQQRPSNQRGVGSPPLRKKARQGPGCGLKEEDACCLLWRAWGSEKGLCHVRCMTDQSPTCKEPPSVGAQSAGSLVSARVSSAHIPLKPATWIFPAA